MASRLSWDDLQFVLALARGRSLAEAARTLAVDQSTVGRRVTAFEKTSGARLFQRTSGGWALTAEGESVQAHLEEIERRALGIGRQLAAHRGGVSGQVRLATSESFATWFLVPRLGGLRARHPELALELVTGNHFADLDRREADLSLRFSRPAEKHLVARRLGRGGWAVYASVGYLDRHTGALHTLVGLSPELERTIGWRWQRENASLGTMALTFNSMLTQAEAIVAGLGIGALPCLFGDRHPQLRRVFPKAIGHHEIWLAVHPDVRPSARVRAVMEFLRRLLASEAPLLQGRRARK